MLRRADGSVLIVNVKPPDRMEDEGGAGRGGQAPRRAPAISWEHAESRARKAHPDRNVVVSKRPGRTRGGDHEQVLQPLPRTCRRERRVQRTPRARVTIERGQ